MDPLTTSDIIQIAVVIAAVGSSIIALCIAAKDRRAAAEEASRERKFQSLRGELDLAMRLLTNTSRGGSTDPLERARLGAEQMALVGLLGEKRIPRLWKRRMNVTDEALRKMLDDPQEKDFKKWEYESLLAVNEIVRELSALEGAGK
ncbi:hypothetical protein [Leifsonia poae]|uniref:hypothetical protein n=1 Tax=Leifsonia poae TaxID=110933 RepID=UPI003D67E822